jgi:hypothetical protein
MSVLALAASLICVVSTARAESLHLLRRWVVFPYASEPALKDAAENAWYKTRERIIADKKYLVATKQFLVQKDVLQPRKELSEDDVKLLANLLEADVLVTGFNEHREFTLNAYLAQNGKLLWTKKIGFHPSLKAVDQLELISDKLTTDLLNEIPYQAFTIIDPLVGKPVYEEGAKKFVMIDAGLTPDLTGGMDLHWVDVTFPDDAKGPLMPQMKVTVIGEGKIRKVRRGVVTAELISATDEKAIQERTLVRIPKIAAKFAKSYTDSGANVGQERLAPEMAPTMLKPVAPQATGARRNTMIFGSILGVIGVVLMAL